MPDQKSQWPFGHGIPVKSSKIQMIEYLIARNLIIGYLMIKNLMIRYLMIENFMIRYLMIRNVMIKRHIQSAIGIPTYQNNTGCSVVAQSRK